MSGPADRPTQAVILAGGRGTRLRPLTDDRPKAMIPFHGRPFLAYVLEMLREQGFERVLLLLGYLPHVFTEHFGDGSGLGLSIEYDVTGADDLTAYRVHHARDRLDETFLLLYCDNYWPMRFDTLWRSYVQGGVPAQVTVYANRDGYSRDSVCIGEDGLVAVYDRSRTADRLQGVEISYAILDRDTILPLVRDDRLLFEEAVYPALTERRQLRAYVTEHRYYSVGGHDRLAQTDAFLARRPTVILDRDGVLNERPPPGEYVRAPEHFTWLPGARQALRLFTQAGWRVIVVSNQAGVARGLLTSAQLSAVHQRMQADALAVGGRIDAIYHCPHGWDDGCACRKPRPGMLFEAQRAHHLDLSRTWLLGDDERDLDAAAAAGCPAALVDARRPLLHYAEMLVAHGTLQPVSNGGTPTAEASCRALEFC